MTRRPRLKKPISWEQVRSEVEFLAAFGGVEYGGVEHHKPLDREHARNNRRYAQVRLDDGVIELADAVRRLPRAHRLALYAHELGHLADPTGTELGADRQALKRFGVVIGYDDRWPGKGLQYALRAPEELWQALQWRQAIYR